MITFLKSSELRSLEDLAGVYIPRPDNSHLHPLPALKIVDRILDTYRSDRFRFASLPALKAIFKFIREKHSEGNYYPLISLISELDGLTELIHPQSNPRIKRKAARLLKQIGGVFKSAVRGECKHLNRLLSEGKKISDGYRTQIHPSLTECQKQLDLLSTTMGTSKLLASAAACSKLGIKARWQFNISEELRDLKTRCETAAQRIRASASGTLPKSWWQRQNIL